MGRRQFEQFVFFGQRFLKLVKLGRAKMGLKSLCTVFYSALEFFSRLWDSFCQTRELFSQTRKLAGQVRENDSQTRKPFSQPCHLDLRLPNVIPTAK